MLYVLNYDFPFSFWICYSDILNEPATVTYLLCFEKQTRELSLRSLQKAFKMFLSWF